MQDFFSFDVLNTWPERPLVLNVYADGSLVSTHKVKIQETIKINLTSDCVIKLSLLKNPKIHTQVDSNNQIINDAMLVVGNYKINDFDLIDHHVNCRFDILTTTDKQFFGVMSEITDIEFSIGSPAVDWLYQYPELYIS